jgi:hypothetical protein
VQISVAALVQRWVEMSYLNQEILQFVLVTLHSNYFWAALLGCFLSIYLLQKVSDWIDVQPLNLLQSAAANLFAVSFLFLLFLCVPLIVFDLHPIPKTSAGGKWVIGFALGLIAAKLALFFERKSKNKSARF